MHTLEKPNTLTRRVLTGSSDLRSRRYFDWYRHRRSVTQFIQQQNEIIRTLFIEPAAGIQVILRIVHQTLTYRFAMDMSLNPFQNIIVLECIGVIITVPERKQFARDLMIIAVKVADRLRTTW